MQVLTVLTMANMVFHCVQCVPLGTSWSRQLQEYWGDLANQWVRAESQIWTVNFTSSATGFWSQRQASYTPIFWQLPVSGLRPFICWVLSSCQTVCALCQHRCSYCCRLHFILYDGTLPGTSQTLIILFFPGNAASLRTPPPHLWLRHSAFME